MISYLPVDPTSFYGQGDNLKTLSNLPELMPKPIVYCLYIPYSTNDNMQAKLILTLEVRQKQ